MATTIKTIKTPIRCFVTPRVMKDFSGVRGHVQNALKAQPQSVTYSDAVRQIEAFQRAASPKK